MERVCFTFEIRPGSEAEYKRRHDEIWPELVEAIEAAGFRNYSLFRRGLQVVAYAECEPDVSSAFASIRASEVDSRWSDYMSDTIILLADEHGEVFRLDEVWHLD